MSLFDTVLGIMMAGLVVSGIFRGMVAAAFRGFGLARRRLRRRDGGPS